MAYIFAVQPKYFRITSFMPILIICSWCKIRSFNLLSDLHFIFVEIILICHIFCLQDEMEVIFSLINQ